VNISSASAKLGRPELAWYAASKRGVRELTESMRFETRERGKGGFKWSTIHRSYIAKRMFEGAKLRGIGDVIAPLLPDHDVAAEAIVEPALVKGRCFPKRPRTVRSIIPLKGLVPDELYQRCVAIPDVTGNMKAWKGRK
jgi:NAD(P)-dependent dehydrogenase (short-subunit alcohol dehydrogenase family)